MSKTLQQERESWEGHIEDSPHKRLVTHFELPGRDAYLSILVEGISGANDEMTLYYDMIRYFKIGGDWVASCDIKSGSAQDVMRKIGDVI